MFGLSITKKVEPLLLKAAWIGDERKVREFLHDNAALINTPVTPAIRRETPALEEGATPLLLAARRGHTHLVQLFIAARADITATTSMGATALHCAAIGGHRDVVEFLLNHKVSTETTTPDGSTSLHLAARAGHDDVVELLIARGATVDSRNLQGTTPLSEAALAGRLGAATLLMAVGADVRTRDIKGRSPLHEVILTRFNTSLTGNPMSPGIPGPYGSSGMAGAPGSLGTPANAGISGSGGNSGPVHSVTLAVALALIDALLHRGAQINDVDGSGETALDLLVNMAGKKAEPTLLQFLIENDAKCVRYQSRLLQMGVPTVKQINVNRSASPRRAEAAYQNAKSRIGQGTKGASRAGGLKNGRSRIGQGIKANSASRISAAQKSGRSRIAPGIAANSASRAGSATAIQKSLRPSWGDQPIILGDRTVTIGRNRKCDVHYLSLTLSDMHARVYPHENGYIIIDLKSRNGVLVNSVRITAPHRLAPDDLIKLGAYGFTFDGKRLIPTHGELPVEKLEAEQRLAKRHQDAAKEAQGEKATQAVNPGAPQPSNWAKLI